MSHEIETMMAVGATPWHGLGKVLESAPTSADAIRMAGLDWEVETVPMVTADDGAACPGAATRRTTDRKVLGVVGPDYTVLQNRDAFSFFDPFLDAGEAELHTAGSLRGGTRVWVLAKIKRDPIVIVPRADDRVERFILLSNSHDGTMAVRVGFTPIRVVCANTLAMAHGDKASKLIRVRHHSAVKANLDAIRDIMNTANSEFEATAEQFRVLAAKEIHYGDLTTYVQRVFPTVNTDKKARKGGILDTITDLFETGRGATDAGVAGTMWGAYNAVNEYFGYVRGRSQDNRLDSLWFGTGAADNKRALTEALAMCE